MVWTGVRAIKPPRPEGDRAILALAAEGIGEFEWDIARDEVTLPTRTAEILGFPTGTAQPVSLRALIEHAHPDDSSGLPDALLAGLKASGCYDLRFRFRRPDNHREIWLSFRAIAIRSAEGGLTGMLAVVRDITTAKSEESQRDALIVELDHRVKNVLASVQSLAAQSARQTVSLDAFLKTFFGRLEAMAAAHTLLTATRWRGAEMSQIVAAELGGLAAGQASWRGPDIVLSPRATHALTLALHELGANAVKHGALSIDSGHVDVQWRWAESAGFELTWTEHGGPVVEPPTRRGFGSTLLERVTGKELGGGATLEFNSEGLRATFRGNAAALAEGPAERLAPSLPQIAVADTAASAIPTGEASGSDISGARVLIVEDSVLLALELESGLVESGALVVGVAADLDEALGLLSLNFDVAVLDVNLNGRLVTPVADALATRGTPFIFATGRGDPSVGPAHAAAPVVRKPYNVHQIAGALAAAMSKSRHR